ncbi:MAG: DUF4124 domain-containing protein [Deltaproteobacteria bacterium]|nr:DUF4124 domain-containing protein [Deltaproteobacteria bacterium]
MYKWVDKDGKIYFTDQKPPEEATEVKEYGKDGIKKEEPKEEPQVSEDGLTLKDVDLIIVSPYYKDGVLRISIFQKNRYMDKLVTWEEGTVSCECEIYQDIGRRTKRKGNKICSVSHELTRWDQNIYVDAPKKYFENGKKVIIECLVDTGYRKLKATSNPSFGTQKDSPGGKIRGGASSQTLN